MRVILCVEDRGGMVFNERRVSRDREVIADIVKDMKGKSLFAEEYSKILFEGFECDVNYAEAPLAKAKETDTCFVEREALSAYVDKIDAVTIYRWNRSYPWDKRLDIDLSARGFRLVSTTDMVGYSHEKITKEIYVK